MNIKWAKASKEIVFNLGLEMHLKMFFDKFKTVSTRLNLYFIWEIRKWSKYGNLLSFKTYWSTKSELKKQEKGGKEAGREAGREREREVEKMSKRINRKFKHSLQHGKYACLSFFTFKVDGPKIYFTKRCKKENVEHLIPMHIWKYIFEIHSCSVFLGVSISK